MYDLVINNATLPDGRTGLDIAVKNKKIAAVESGITAQAQRQIDAQGYLVTQPFIDSHFHMDSTLSLGEPRLNMSGTLLEGIQLWTELKPHLTKEHIQKRARKLCAIGPLLAAPWQSAVMLIYVTIAYLQ